MQYQRIVADELSFDEIPLIGQSPTSVEYRFSGMDTGRSEDQFLVGGQNRRRSSTMAQSGCSSFWTSCCRCCSALCRWSREYRPRTIRVGYPVVGQKFPANTVKNQKYNLITFIPLVLFQQFRFFLNLYFLVMALSQFIPDIRIGYLSTYWGPLGFVLTVTLCREAYDDFSRYLRDKEMNSAKYEKITTKGSTIIPSSAISVGDLIRVRKDQRVPADMILLRTTEKTGGCFIRTDQLDGETDWKLRIANPTLQQLETDQDVFNVECYVFAEKPQKDIHGFIGTFRKITQDNNTHEDALSLENTMWTDTVVASGTAVGLVVYTGRETRTAMNASQPRSKVGLLDLELNNLTKILCAVVVGLAFVMVVMKGFSGPWYRYFFRFILLFSYIIPISLRVNLDMAKTTYARLIGWDKAIKGTIVRSSTIPEELGRISYLLSDKTGTLTMNQMVFKKLHLGSVSFTSDTFDDIVSNLKSAYASGATKMPSVSRQSVMSKIQQAVEAIALCHNVTPVYDSDSPPSDRDENTEADQQMSQQITYQASSPDEVALVNWTEQVGVTLVNRDLQSMSIRLPDGSTKRYVILQMFPFTSESKRMGIILKDEELGTIMFLMKGADAVMKSMVHYNDWLEEECSNMAREGLRTLVVAQKPLTEQQYAEFEKQYQAARVAVTDRAGRVTAVLARLEQDLQLLCLTGVEDKLQQDVRTTLEQMANAGVKVWMLTGDKLETAVCIAKSSRLVSKTQNIHVFRPVLNRSECHTELSALRRKIDTALVIQGDSLKVCIENYEEEFAELACGCPAVVCCRCSPEQKSQIVEMLTKYLPNKRIAAVGDGGNDVGMILAAHAGIGIVGKEGKQASLAADFSITQFSHISRLLLVHGRYCYKRSCALGQFVMHRGLIITTMQAIFSCVFYFASVSLYQGALMVAYSTIYTMFPVFSLVMDRDVDEKLALTYPELYKELVKGRSLSYKTFFIWFLASVYQGAAIMYGALILFENDFVHIVSISFTALIITELVMVALTVHIWHWTMMVSEAFSLLIYVVSIFVLDQYFDVHFVQSGSFWWKTVAITAVSCLPLYIFKFLQKKISPPSYVKVS